METTVFDQRLARYCTANSNGCPDRIPIRPFAAELAAKAAGMTSQEVTQDYDLAFESVREFARQFDCDALVPNMVWLWGGIPQVLGTRYYAIPGVGIPPNGGFQYLEPPEGQEWMREDEYAALADDPTAFLIETWMPRTQARIQTPGKPVTWENQMALLKGGMAVMQYFGAFGEASARLRSECAMPSAIHGILKSPFDIIADKFRGYIGMTMDLFERPDEVSAAVEALTPHMLAVAKASADPQRVLPVTIWMHRGCVPFITPAQFDRFYWPSLKPIIEELWADRHQTLFYAEGKWKAHWDAFLELPEGSIIVHCDRDDIFEAKKKLGHKFAISGGIPNALLSYGKPNEVRSFCRRVISEVAIDGGYIADAGAILQNDTSLENMRVMVDTFREYGVYSRSSLAPVRPAFQAPPNPLLARNHSRPPGTVEPWAGVRGTLPEIFDREDLVQKSWDGLDGWSYAFLWHCVVSF